MLKISSPVCLPHGFKVELVMGWRSSSQFGLAGRVELFWGISRTRRQTWPGRVFSAEGQGCWWWPFSPGEGFPPDRLHRVSQLQARKASCLPGTGNNTKVRLQITSCVTLIGKSLQAGLENTGQLRVPLVPVMGNQCLMKPLPCGNDASLAFP